jgi:hypothetical protein
MNKIQHPISITLLLAVLATVWATTVVVAQEEVGCQTDVIVQADDWLSKIAEKEYGDQSLYPAIALATNLKAATDPNYAVIDNHDIIEPGWKLCLPDKVVAEELTVITPFDPTVLTVDALENATYQSDDFDGAITLVNGEYLGEPFEEGGETRPQASLANHMAFGDLNGEGMEDAVVAIIYSGGGSGTFYYLAAMLNQDGLPVQVAITFLGDRSPVKSIEIVGDNIYASYVTQGPDDPQCCPTQAVTKKFQLQVDQLTEVSSETSQTSEALTPEALRNATYKSEDFDGEIQLTNGQYEGEPFVEGGASRPRAVLTEHMAFGDLTGDGIEDAVAVLVFSGGGSGNFRYLALFEDHNGVPTNIATTWIGDRVKMKGVAIENGQVKVNMVTQGPDDGACCPTLEVINTYELQEGQLVETDSQEIVPIEAGDGQPQNVFVNSIEIEIRDGDYYAIFSGDMPDACTQISGSTQEVQDIFINISLQTTSTGDVCAQQITPFTYEVLLDVSGLPTDQQYVVAIGDENRPFTLSAAYDETQYEPGECEIEFFADVPVYDAVEGTQLGTWSAGQYVVLARVGIQGSAWYQATSPEGETLWIAAEGIGAGKSPGCQK